MESSYNNGYCNPLFILTSGSALGRTAFPFLLIALPSDHVYSFQLARIPDASYCVQILCITLLGA